MKNIRAFIHQVSSQSAGVEDTEKNIIDKELWQAVKKNGVIMDHRKPGARIFIPGVRGKEVYVDWTEAHITKGKKVVWVWDENGKPVGVISARMAKKLDELSSASDVKTRM